MKELSKFKEQLTFIERILFLLCSNKSNQSGGEFDDVQWNSDNALDFLIQKIPNFTSEVDGKVIVDFGCGRGYQTLALANTGAKKVIGLDTYQKNLDVARELIDSSTIRSKVVLTDSLGEEKVDIVLSQNSFEHFDSPEDILDIMYQMLKPGGKVLLTFGPLWNSPYGSHMQYFCPIPWSHKIFSEKSILNVRKWYRNDDASRYRDLPGGMNCYSLKQFEKIIYSSPLKVVYSQYDTVKNVPFRDLPFIREFFVNHLTFVLEK